MNTGHSPSSVSEPLLLLEGSGMLSSGTSCLGSLHSSSSLTSMSGASKHWAVAESACRAGVTGSAAAKELEMQRLAGGVSPGAGPCTAAAGRCSGPWDAQLLLLEASLTLGKPLQTHPTHLMSRSSCTTGRSGVAMRATLPRCRSLQPAPDSISTCACAFMFVVAYTASSYVQRSRNTTDMPPTAGPRVAYAAARGGSRPHRDMPLHGVRRSSRVLPAWPRSCPATELS